MVTGHDKNPTKIYIKFWAMKMAVFAAGGSAGENANALNETGSEDPVYGTLTVFAKRAHGLPRMDAWSGKADPYLTITVDGMTQKTKVKNRTLQPKWDEKFEFPGEKVLRCRWETSFPSHTGQRWRVVGLLL